MQIKVIFTFILYLYFFRMEKTLKQAEKIQAMLFL
nr:MAG TPA: hypothetical protein [Caudoviricetes sp.]